MECECACDRRLQSGAMVSHPTLINGRHEQAMAERFRRAREENASGVGLRQVAKVAGVSTATVSRAINKPDAVSPELRERITAVIADLGWVPDGAARALATRRSHAIGAVFPALSVGDFARATDAIQHELLDLGYTLLLACSEYDPDQELRQVRQFIERGVDGLILVGRAHHQDLESLLAQRGTPHVFGFVYGGDRKANCIGPDNRKAMVQLTNYLLDLGHVSFAVIAQSGDNNDRAEARLQGIRDALAMRGLGIRPQHMATGRWTIAEGRMLFRQIVASEPRPTAVICGNAHLGVGAIIESQALGIQVPGQMSIVSYDDIEIMSHLSVPMTALRIPSEEVGRNTARHVVSQVEGRPLHVVQEVIPELLVRASSGPPPPRSGA